jgi:hypothetical protein
MHTCYDSKSLTRETVGQHRASKFGRRRRRPTLSVRELYVVNHDATLYTYRRTLVEDETN